MAEIMLQEPKKASFLDSMTSGIGGFIKGALAGGLSVHWLAQPSARWQGFLPVD
jgi:hypothetical protein